MIGVTGANGSVGRNLLAHVAERGQPCAALVRSERAAARLPEAATQDVHVVSYGSVADLSEAVRGVTCLVHLAGILIESASSTYETANVASTAAVSEAAAAAGVERFVLVSVLGADPASANRFLRSRGEAERLAAASGVPTTVLRTPILLGPGTAGAAALARSVTAGHARLLGGGRHTLRPLDVDDLSRAILALCAGDGDGVVTLELVGPEAVTHRELLERAAVRAGREVSISAVPVWIAKAGARLVGLVRAGGMTPDVIDVITSSERVERNADAELGLALTPLDDTLAKLFASTVRAS